jgi:hypothetical protein
LGTIVTTSEKKNVKGMCDLLVFSLKAKYMAQTVAVETFKGIAQKCE